MADQHVDQIMVLLREIRGSTVSWVDSSVQELTGIIDLTEIGCRLPLADVYDGVTFDALEA
jgi:hypothetical protein